MRQFSPATRPLFTVALATGLLAAPVAAQDITTIASIEFVTVGDVRNAALPVDGSLNTASGRGRVDYAFNIGRTPINTAQWVEFVNTFSTQSDDLRLFGLPSYWGAQVDPTYDGPGIRWRIGSNVDAERIGVGGISWREAAQYANWLHNHKSSSLSAIEGGAYDTSTWGDDPDNQPFGVTDAPHREPGARYWIPGLDEWLKAVYYDPDKDGPGQGGWWSQPGGSDDELISGVPGIGQTTAGIEDRDLARSIPLGAYDVQSPWGLKDVSGGVIEWFEDYFPGAGEGVERITKGTAAGTLGLRADAIDSFGSSLPTSKASDLGFRIATSVPAPGAGALLGVVVFSSFTRTRR